MTANDDPNPPSDYGNGDAWADHGPWYVPPNLRPYYASAEPSDAEKAGYIQEGVHVEEEQTYEVQRVADTGDAERPPRVITETNTDTSLVHRTGATYFPTWLHLKRLERAARRKAADDRQAAIEAAWSICQICHRKGPDVRTTRLPSPPHPTRAPRLLATVCRDCLPVVDREAREAFAEREDSREVADGQTIRSAARDLIRHLMEA